MVAFKGGVERYNTMGATMKDSILVGLGMDRVRTTFQIRVRSGVVHG